jgi:antibiotic biosynthesis monooxygenase
MMLLTILEAPIAPGREKDLQSAYSAATTGTLPAGLLRTELLRDARDPARWRIQTLWRDRAALEAMRGAGTPAGVLMFRAAGAEPTLSIHEVVGRAESPERDHRPGSSGDP